jgi:hypothetical protein
VLTNFAAGTLIVLGVLLVVLGVLAGNGNVTFTLIGLGSVVVGGILGLLGRRTAA